MLFYSTHSTLLRSKLICASSLPHSDARCTPIIRKSNAITHKRIVHHSIARQRDCMKVFSNHVGGGTPPPLPSIADLSSAEDILSILDNTPLSTLMEAAAALRDQGHSNNVITFSPKVFLPLTRLCRDACGYCTFAQGPVPGRRVYMTLDEVVDVARMGATLGCTEALFTLGALIF